MTAIRWLLSQWKLIAASVVAAAIVHIWLTLSATAHRVSPGYAALAGNLPTNRVVFLPPLEPGKQPLPFMMPDMLYAICKFDASQAAIRLKVQLPEAGYSLSLHSRDGANFYFVSGTNERATDLDVVLQVSGTAFFLPRLQSSGGRTERPRVALPGAYGMAVLRVPIKGLAYRRIADEHRDSFSCAPIAKAEARR
ncbi:MAG: hypothetical protein KDJ36_05585 [Hyphomicrobiaceae bacterium]|nr:hypothetical protein [Hyphomicrobiaceae bacterium]